VEFRNVSLVPGHRTTVQIQDASNSVVKNKNAQTRETAALKPISPDIAKKALELRTFSESYGRSHDLRDPKVRAEFGKELSSRTAEIKALLKGTVAEPLLKQQEELLPELQSAQKAKDSKKLREINEQFQAIGAQLDRMMKESAESDTNLPQQP
jgi:hypothetical protein